MFNDCFIMSDNKICPVMVLGVTNQSITNFTFDKEYNLVNFNKDGIAAVIHQYDRVPLLKANDEKNFI